MEFSEATHSSRQLKICVEKKVFVPMNRESTLLSQLILACGRPSQFIVYFDAQQIFFNWNEIFGRDSQAYSCWLFNSTKCSRENSRFPFEATMRWKYMLSTNDEVWHSNLFVHTRVKLQKTAPFFAHTSELFFWRSDANSEAIYLDYFTGCFFSYICI